MPNWNPGGYGPGEGNKVFRQIEDRMVALKTEIDPKEISGKPKDPAKPPKTRFGIFGEEMIEKEVKLSGNTGRVYLPLDWVGKQVKIIRVD
jgi:hypothetical protein